MPQGADSACASFLPTLALTLETLLPQSGHTALGSALSVALSRYCKFSLKV